MSLNIETLKVLKDEAHKAQAQALKAEALANYYDDTLGTRTEAERDAYIAQTKIDDLVEFSEALLEALGAAEAKLADAVDGENALDAYMAGDPNA